MLKLDPALFENAPVGDLFPNIPKEEKERLKMCASVSLCMRKARLKFGLTEKELGKMLGYSRYKIIRIEDGDEKLSLTEIETLLKKLAKLNV